MDMRRIERSLKQIHSLRQLLRDHNSPVNEIKRPEGMRLGRFNARIVRLRGYEDEFQAAFGDGMRRFIEQEQKKRKEIPQ